MGCEVPRSVNHYEELKKAYYTPQNDKFEGYNQFPRPVVAPYQNQLDTRNMTRQFKDKQRQSLSLMKNVCTSPSIQDLASKTLTGGKFVKQCNVGVDYLSGRINAMTDLKNTLGQQLSQTGFSRAISGIPEKSQTIDDQSPDQGATMFSKSKKSLRQVQTGYSMTRPNSMVVQTPNDIKKQKILNEFAKYLPSGEEVSGSKKGSFNKSPTVGQTRKVEKIIKVIAQNESGAAIHGRILTSPASVQLFKQKRPTIPRPETMQGTMVDLKSQLNFKRDSLSSMQGGPPQH